MAIISIFSPGIVYNAASNGPTSYSYTNPFASQNSPASDAWIQCYVNWFLIWNTIGWGGFGILEYESLDNQGAPQITSFGDITNPALDSAVPDLPTRMFVPQLLSVTVAYVAYNLDARCQVTMFQWG